MKIIIFSFINIFIFVNILIARDDPFTPNIAPYNKKLPYYGIDSVFNSIDITLPSSARLIKKVDITYQNIDGSIEIKSVPLSGKIYWQYPLRLSQIKNDNRSQSARGNRYIINDNTIKIFYKGQLKRHFPMVNPDRIVLDFDINMSFYKKNPINLNTKYFSKIKYGLHDSFLRIVLQTNGRYIYDIKKDKDGLLISVK